MDTGEALHLTNSLRDKIYLKQKKVTGFLVHDCFRLFGPLIPSFTPPSDFIDGFAALGSANHGSDLTCGSEAQPVTLHNRIRHDAPPANANKAKIHLVDC